MSKRPESDNDLPTIDPSGVGEYVKHGSCPRYAKLRYDDDGEETARDWTEAFNPLNPLLSETGQDFEDDIYDAITEVAHTVTDSWNQWDDQEENESLIRDHVLQTARRSADAGPTMLMQARFADTIEAFFVAGDSDLVVLWPQAENHVHIRIFDIKSSYEEKTYHQVQTACYSLLLEKVLDHEDIRNADITYSIDTGVIHRESDYTPVTPDSMPMFERAPREADVRRLLEEGGELATAFGYSVDEVPHQFDSVCRACPYNESCYTRALEAADIRLLQLSRGEQDTLRDEGLTTLSDVAELIDPPEDPRPYEYNEPEIRPEHRNLVQRLSEQHGIGERLPVLAQKAQALLAQLDSDHPDAHDAPWAPWIIGTGQGSLPEDDPPYDADMSIQRGSLIRVYLNVQWDYLRDRISMVSCRVDCTNYDGTPLTFSRLIEDIPDDEDAEAEQEQALLEDAFQDMFNAIRTVAQLAGRMESAPVHLYFYTEQERDALMDGVKRHPELSSAQAVRDLLGLRAGIDQPMVSVIQKDIESRLAPTQPSTGLLPMWEATYPSHDDALDYEEWTYTREDGTTVDLQQAFSQKLFNYQVSYSESDDEPGIKLHHEPGETGDDWYPARARYDASIPLEYIWAAEGIDELTPEWTDEENYKGIIEMFRYVNHRTKTHRITREDVKELGRKFCHAIEHVERGLKFKNADITKQAIPLDDLETFTLGDPSLADACREYLDLEYATNKQDVLSLLQKPIKQRILSGDSVPIRVQNARNEDGLLIAEGELIYDEFDFASPTSVAAASRQSGSDGGGSGSWMVASPIEKQNNTYQTPYRNPEQILHSAPVTIDRFDPYSGEVRLVAYPDGGGSDDRYRTWHRRWTTDASDSDVYFGPGEEFILDPRIDDLTANRADVALDHPDQNGVYNLLEALSKGDEDAETTDWFDAEAANTFTEWLVDNYDPSPNAEQQQFIRGVTPRVSLLQGPPGTGKTSGATALALLARAYAAAQDGNPLRTLVSGPSNKSIDEVLEDVALALQAYREAGHSEALDDVLLVRLTDDVPDDPLPGVEYLSYNNDDHYDDLERLSNRLRSDSGSRQAELTEATGGGSQPHVFLFSTPSRMFGLAKHMTEGMPEVFYRSPTELFDVMAVDEASMMPLPQLLLSGAFLSDNGQLLVSGDQRQMPPVQRHDWNLEDRRTVEQVAPFVSTLDYFRFLRGDDVADVPDEVSSPDVSIPLVQLQETYRCHSTVADFLQEWVYSKDDINYQSSRTYTIPTPDVDTEGLETVLQPDAPLTLILHDDETSRQSNVVEAELAQRLTEAMPESESVGIVTPHNSQKGLLSTMCADETMIDTVERFQGGQQDAMVISTTVSDPDYLDAESEFILNPNRLNVALSRMKKKLIVMAPKSIFRVLPKDVDEYEDSIIWKGLYQEVNAADRDGDWEGTLADLVGGVDADESLPGADTGIEVYTSE